MDNRRHQQLGDKKVWIRAKIMEIVEDYLKISIPDEHGLIYVKKGSFEYTSVGKMTKDYEFRTDLKKFDIIDCYDRGKWNPATIMSRREERTIGLTKVDYNVAFRLYYDHAQNIEDAKQYMLCPSESTDRDGKWIGEPESMDEWISFYSARIQKPGTYLGTETKKIEGDNTYFIDEFIPVTT